MHKKEYSPDKEGQTAIQSRDSNFHAKIKLYIIIAIATIYMITLPVYQAILGDSIEIGSSTTIQLSGEEWNADQYIKSGISVNEQIYTWSKGKNLVFYPFRGAKGDYDMTITIREILNEKQTIKVLLNDIEVGSETLQYLPDGQEQEMHVQIHFTKAINKIELQFPDAITPRIVAGTDDDRVLAVQLVRILFEKTAD